MYTSKAALKCCFKTYLCFIKKKKTLTKNLNNIKENNWNLRGRSGHNRNKLKIFPKSDSDLQNIGTKWKQIVNKAQSLLHLWQ